MSSESRGWRRTAGVAVTARKDRPTFVANEFRSMIDRLPRLGAELPDLTRYLLA